MTTLIKVCNSEGDIGRCDAKCYDATGPECICICGGANHGKGRSQAMENTADMVEYELEHFGLSKQLEQFRQLRGLKNSDPLTVTVGELQPSLPEF